MHCVAATIKKISFELVNNRTIQCMTSAFPLLMFPSQMSAESAGIL